MKRRKACFLIAAAPAAAAADFASNWSSNLNQIWLGPEYWANRLQDWRLRNGRIECVVSGGDRNIFLLTHELSSRLEPFETRVELGRLEEDTTSLGEGFAGFRIGMRGPFNDYRDTAIYGIGLDAGLSASGQLFIGDPAHASQEKVENFKHIQLRLRAEPEGSTYTVTVTARDPSGRQLAEVSRKLISAEWMAGGVAVVCSAGTVVRTPDPSQNVMTLSGINRRGRDPGGAMRFWFRDWKVSGQKVDVRPERAWGPILFAMHTLSGKVLKLTAQMAPVNPAAGGVRLQVREAGSTGAWRTVGESSINPLARTATFRIADWNDARDTAYRVVYGGQNYEGVVRHNPLEKTKLVVAALSCINDLGFPHPEILRNLQHFKPDLVLWVGDQIYERSASYGIERLPLERATLDYLRKWYLFGWGFGDLLRDTPSVCMPDDHDVYHGNVWGAGGRHAEGFGQAGQDSGGYVEPAQWVNMVQRTQTSHLPDPFDPTPVEQNIGVYYTDLRYGGVSFAILEDRKWKSAPKMAIPKARIVNGWAKNPEYHPARDGDVPGAQLLGPRQIAFLHQWAADWTGGVWMKAAVSQTILANVATLPPPADTDAVTPGLQILPPGGYAESEMKVADHDSNGWPQTPRNEALRAIRRALAVHIAGDQHLGSTLQYGIDRWGDAAWAICVPAVSNLFPRRWYPSEPGKNPKPGSRNTGEYLDAFGNKVTVHAVFNPATVDVAPKIVNYRAPGYGIIEFDRATQDVRFTNWPRWVDASLPGAQPCEGWPIMVKYQDNGLPRSGWELEPVSSSGGQGALVEVVDQAAGEHVYTYRMLEAAFTPPVFKEGHYTVTVRSPEGKVITVRRNVTARRAG